jgi:hypothetical protein
MATPISENEGVRFIGDFTDDAINDAAALERITKFYERTKRRSRTRAVKRRAANSHKVARGRRLAKKSGG